MNRFAFVCLVVSLLLLPACGGGGGESPPPVAAPVVIPDTTPPSTAADPAGGDFDRIIEVNLTASEEANLFVSLDGGEFLDRGASPFALVLSEGTTTIEYYAVDTAGNIETEVRRQTYRVDLSPPELTFGESPPAPLAWLTSAEVTWTTDEQCGYTVEIVETGEILDEGELDANARATLKHDARKLPDAALTIRIEATDWTGRTSRLEYTIEREAPETVALEEEPGDVVVSPSGDRAFVARRQRTEVDVVELATGEIVETIDVGIRPWNLALHPDGELIYVSNSVSPGTIATIDVDSYTVTELEAFVGTPGPIAFSGDGLRAYCTDFIGNVLVIDVDPSSATYHEVERRVYVARDLLSGRIVASHDGAFLLVHWDPFVSTGLTRVDLENGTETVTTLWSSNLQDGVNFAAPIVLSADDATAFVGSLQLLCTQCRYDLDAGELEQAAEDEDGLVESPSSLALFDADERLLAASLDGSYLRLFDAATMAYESRFDVGRGVRSVVVTPDGGYAIGSRLSGSTRELFVLRLR